MAPGHHAASRRCYVLLLMLRAACSLRISPHARRLTPPSAGHTRRGALKLSAV